jgi:hypothetical protein
MTQEFRVSHILHVLNCTHDRVRAWDVPKHISLVLGRKKKHVAAKQTGSRYERGKGQTQLREYWRV